MCLGIPGKVTHIEENPMGLHMGKVSFGGIVKDVCLAYVPDVQVGEYVIVHVGFAINKVDEQEAMEVFAMLKQMGELDELEEFASPPAPVPHALS
jgi:hydrogenase expression/formation protein HypC